MRGGQTRREAVGAAGAIGAGALFGCGPGGGGAPEPQSARPAKLLFGRRSSAAEQPVLEQYVAAYRQVAPQTTVEMVSLPSGLQEMRQGLIAGFAGGAGPDLFISDGPWLPEFATAGLLDPMPDEVSRDLKANFTDGGQRYGSYKGVT